MPLAVYSAMAGARLRRPRAAPTIALTGGILAAGALGLTGLLGWTLSRTEITGDTALVRTLYLLAFLVGGAGHIVALGVLVAGIAVGGAGLAGAGADLAGGTDRGAGLADRGGRMAESRTVLTSTFVLFRSAADISADLAVAWM